MITSLSRKILVLSAAILLSLALPSLTLAAQFRTGEEISFPASETVAEDLYIVGGNVSASGTVRGDLVAAGGNVLVSSAVSTDAAVTGGTVVILGDIGDDLRTAGGNVTVQGKVGGDLLIGGGQVTVGGAGIGGDVVIGGGVARIEAPVNGNVRVGGGEVYINSTVGGNVLVMAEKLTLGPNAVITGNLEYTASEEVRMETGAVVRGETKFTQSERPSGVAKAGLAAILSLWFLGKILMTFISALVVALLFKRFSSELVQKAGAAPLTEMGRGFVFLIVVPIASIVLIFTFLGLPLGFLGIFAFVASVIFTCVVAPIVLGSMLDRWIVKPIDYRVNWKTVLLGTFVYVLLGLIPVVGWILKFAIFLIALGAAVNIKWNALKEWR